MPRTNYDGTAGTAWKLGFGGPQLKDSSGTIKARNAGDSADAPITASLGTFSTGVTVTGNATDADPLLDAQANVGTTTAKTARLGMVRTGGLALDETGMCCKMELLTHASDVAGSAVVGLVVGMSNAQAGSADKIGILIQNETGVASFTTGIQLGNDITLEWGDDSEGNFRFLDASQTIVLENDSATGKIRCELGTATSATDFRVTDSASAQLFTVNGAGDVTVAKRELISFVSPAALAAGTTNDYAGLATASHGRMTAGAGGSTLTGLTAGIDGAILRIVNVGSPSLTFNHQDVGSAAANRMILDGGTAKTIATDGWLTLIYDGTTARWRQFLA